ncbi:fibrinogen-like protein 1 [Drosophila navojoa]|uniref:fibrinogen-like protein 1 n=1 Tax=Drosophila navojoa TaxID=7232 RepID=UPI0011BF3D1F|nr:fibrinogen-like protein 1 [Drosophila navojoa]
MSHGSKQFSSKKRSETTQRLTVFRMNKNLTILIICALLELSYGYEVDFLNCAAEKELGDTCGKYCYRIVKPLLQHLSKVSAKNEDVESLVNKIDEQATIIKNMQLENARLESQNQLLASCKSKLAAKDELVEYKKADIKQLELDIIDCRSRAGVETSKLEEQLKIQSNSLDAKGLSCSRNSSDVQEADFSCVSSLGGPGWTVVQRRMNGKVDFNRNWNEYVQGFGQIQDEFFLGLEKLHLLTSSQPHELFIFMRNIANESTYAYYDYFLIADETESYKIKSLGTYTGSAGNMLSHHVGAKFSTIDRDNDNADQLHCATI